MSSRDEWLKELRTNLVRLKERGLYRSLRHEENLIDFSSNDYLSLNSSGKLQQMMNKILLEWEDSVGSTGSRLISGHRSVFEHAEQIFNQWTGFSSSLFFHSGWAANTGALPALIGPGDQVIMDRLCHASLLDGVRLSGAKRLFYRHNDLNDLESRLKKYNNQKNPSSRGRLWLITESVFSMDGDGPDLKSMTELAEKYDALIILDEAHAVGIFGPEGAGMSSLHGLQNRLGAVVFPMGKAPGLMGAFVAGDEVLIEHMIQKARSFIYSTAQPPFLAALTAEVISFLRTEEMNHARIELLKKSEYLRNLLKNSSFDTGQSDSQIIPVILGDDKRTMDAMDRLRRNGLDIRAIRPPTVPAGTARLRLNVHADHNRDILDRVVMTLNQI